MPVAVPVTLIVVDGVCASVSVCVSSPPVPPSVAELKGRLQGEIITYGVQCSQEPDDVIRGGGKIPELIDALIAAVTAHAQPKEAKGTQEKERPVATPNSILTHCARCGGFRGLGHHVCDL